MRLRESGELMVVIFTGRKSVALKLICFRKIDGEQLKKEVQLQ